MIQIPLAAALLVGSPTSDQTLDHLMDLMAPDSGALVRIDDTAARMASEAPGLWLELLAATDFQRALKQSLQELGVKSDEIGTDILGCLAAQHGGVVAIPAGGSVGLFAVIRVSDGFEGALDRLLAAADLTRSENVAFAGRSVEMMEVNETDVFVFERSGEYLLVGGGKPGTLEGTFEHYAARIGKPSEPGKGWWREIETRTPESLVEVFADPPALIGDELPEGVAADYFGLAYMGLSAGSTAGFQTHLTVNFGPNAKIKPMTDAIRPANRSMIALVPPQALGFFSGGVDLAKFMESTALLVEDFEPSAKQQLDNVFEAGSATLGVDIWTELLPAFTGDFLAISYREQAVDEIVNAENPTENPPTPNFVAGVKDAESILVLMETIEGLSGGLLAPSETDSFSLWTADEDVLGQDVCIAVGEDHMIVSSEERARELMARIDLGDGLEGSFLTPDQTRALPSGAWLTVQDNDAAWAMMDDAFEILASDFAEFPSLLDCLKIGVEYLEVNLTGFTYTTINITPKGLRIHAWTD